MSRNLSTDKRINRLPEPPVLSTLGKRNIGVATQLYGSAYEFPAPAGDGSTIQVPTSAATDFALYDKAGSQVWTVLDHDINAACDAWAHLYYVDTVDGEIYVIAIDNATTPDTWYLASLDLALGTITNIGTFQPNFSTMDADAINSGFSSYMCRAAEGSGHFTIAVAENIIVINSGTAAIETAASTRQQNSEDVYDAAPIGYQTDDGAILCSAFDCSATGAVSIQMMRGGGAAELSWVANSPAEALGSNTAGQGFYHQGAGVWGQTRFTTSGSVEYGRCRWASRADLDRFLHELADSAGLPV